MINQEGRFRNRSKNLRVHLYLLFFAMIAIGPIFIILINSFKTTEGIFTGPIKLPNSETFTLDGFKRAVAQGNFVRNYVNSAIITIGATLLTVICSCLAAYGITEYTTKLSKMIAGLFTIGIMLPVTLGTIVIIKMMVWLNILNTHISLIVVYVGIFVPLGVILMVTNFRTVSNDLKEAARIDGANEFKTFLIVVPLVMPGVAAVAAITMLPVWNDLWFPLILTAGPKTQTLTLGIQQFVGTYNNDWQALLAGLVLSAIPLILLFTIFSKQFIKGLSDGYGK